MRVGVLSLGFQPDHGWGVISVERSAALMKLGVEVVAITARGARPPEGITPTDVRPILPPLSGSNTRQALRLLLVNPALARSTTDCNLVDVVTEPYALSCLSTSMARPIVLTACGTYLPLTVRQGPGKWLYRWLYNRARIIAISDYTARQVQQALGGELPSVIMPGVNYATYQTSLPKPPKQRPTVLFVGALKPRKGVSTLIKAMDIVRSNVPDVQCVLIGSLADKKYAQMIEALLAELRLDTTIQLMGYLSKQEIIKWYQQADVFVMPSMNVGMRFEGLSLVLLEANACGVPVIGSRDTGNESAIIDGETGFLVEQGDHRELAERIVDILKDPELQNKLGQAARVHAQRHDWLHVARQTLDFYEQVIAEPRR